MSKIVILTLFIISVSCKETPKVETVDAQNTTVFKNNAKITFDEKFPLTSVACDKINF